MNRPLALLLLLSACGADAARTSPTAPLETTPTEETTVADPATPPPTPSAPPDASLAWSWSGPALGPDVLLLAPAETVDPGGLTCSFGFAEPTRTSTLACVERSGARRWGFDVRDGTTAATLLREGELLIAARFERGGFGAIVERFNLDTGERRWRTVLTGLPVPIGGLAVQAIELAHVGDRIAVRGWDAGGRWVVALDDATGTVSGAAIHEGAGDPVASAPTAAPSSAAAEIAWQWDGPALFDRSRMEGPAEVAIDTPDGRCRWVPEPNGDRSDDDRAHFECLDRRGARVWGFDDASAWPHMTGRALAIEGGTLFVLHFHRAATGASMTAYDLATGAERWTSRMQGIGPIAHSGYMAWAELRMIAGHPVVFGWEASGRYVEEIDPATGATLFHRLVPE